LRLIDFARWAYRINWAVPPELDMTPKPQAPPAPATSNPPAAIKSPAGDNSANAPEATLTLTTPKIAEAFDGEGGLSAAQWREKLADMPEWLRSARASTGAAPNPSTWYPLEFARILLTRGATDESLNRRFLKVSTLRPWRQKWQDERRERNAFGQ